MSKEIRIEEGVTKLNCFETLEEDVTIYLPSTLEKITSSCFVVDKKDIKVIVNYNGTKEDFLKIKKGLMDIYEKDDDWYGSYYHNESTSSTTSREYHNWIRSKNKVVINCLDCSFFDNEEENSKNYYDYQYYKM